MSVPSAQSDLRKGPTDARRGAVVITAGFDPPGGLGGLCDGFVDQGYEVVALAVASQPSALNDAAKALAAPVFLLGIGPAASLGWCAACEPSSFAAISLYDPPLAVLGTGEPLCPVIVHVAAVSSDVLDALRERLPDMPVHPYPDEPGFIWRGGDAARLAGLRTLQAFHRASGKGEMGGG